MSDQLWSRKKLSKKLTNMRIDRPSEWMMDEYIRDATDLEATIERLEEENAQLWIMLAPHYSKSRIKEALLAAAIHTED